MAKGGVKNFVKKIRPISILKIITKLFEKLMHKRLSNSSITNNSLCDHKFGFKKEFYESDARTDFADLTYDSINYKFIAFYLDFSKAIDTVHYKIVLKELNHMGIRGNANKCFETFLIERRHFVALGDEKSSEYISSIRVPQGAVLAPLLFLMPYICKRYV